jgi:hypothetical protein
MVLNILSLLTVRDMILKETHLSRFHGHPACWHESHIVAGLVEDPPRNGWPDAFNSIRIERPRMRIQI